MSTTIDFKNFLIKELLKRNIPWDTKEKDWIKINEFKEGNSELKEFKHIQSNIVLSVRELNNKMLLEYNRTPEHIKSLISYINIDPRQFFVAVSTMDINSDINRISIIDKNFFHSKNETEDDGESLRINTDTMFLLFADVPMEIMNDHVLVKNISIYDVWSRLIEIGYTEYDVFSDAIPYSQKSKNIKEPNIIVKDLDSEIDQIALQQQNTTINTTLKTKLPTANNINRRQISLPNISSKKSQDYNIHSIRVEEEKSNLDTSMFTGDDWPPTNNKDMQNALEKILIKHPLSKIDLEKIEYGFKTLDSSQFITISSLALSLWQNDNPFVHQIINVEKERRKNLGETVEYEKIDTSNLISLDFL